MTTLRAFTMPKWGIEMTEGTIAEWMVAEGGALKRGQIITLIETDKITNEVEAEYDATVARLIARSGETLPVGALLGVFATGKASAAEVDAFITAFRPPDVSTASSNAGVPRPAAIAHGPSALPPTPSVNIPDTVVISPAARAHATVNAVDVSMIKGTGPRGRISFQDVDQLRYPEAPVANGAPVSITPSTDVVDAYYASPLAKRLAVQHNIDLAAVTGTGPRGRISKADVLVYQSARSSLTKKSGSTASLPSSHPVGAAYDTVLMSPMRKAIARQLSLSKQTIPHFYLRAAVRVDGLLAARAEAKRATGEAPSLNDYIVRAAALALRAHPDVNIQVHGDEIRRFAAADISIAVSTPKGLVTPIVRAAETKSVARISAEVKALAERARAGKLTADEIQGGSFSISNLGMYGIDQFDAIINPPQGAILAVGAAICRPIESGHALLFATTIQVSLSCDHRAIDGAVGAQFLSTFRALAEDPDRLTA
ncbi:MAG: 2-oxo acid dehydrogenase subunit E2 [Rhodospirillaceae bacterium]|nr:MAG: 2-oxo acid dehydrogenase subunit E2 [Rhodospirillaceae bacterium]